MATIQKQFGRIIRRRREAAKISQETLANKANLHPTYISLLENGLRTPSIRVVKQLAEALGTTMTSLMAELEKVESHG